MYIYIISFPSPTYVWYFIFKLQFPKLMAYHLMMIPSYKHHNAHAIT